MELLIITTSTVQTGRVNDGIVFKTNAALDEQQPPKTVELLIAKVLSVDRL